MAWIKNRSTKVNKLNLSAEDVQSVLSRHFEPRYKVYSTRMPFRDFVVKKSGLVGAGVKVKNEQDGTTITTSPFTPSKVAFLGLHQFVWALLLGRKWKKLEEEIFTCLANEQEFK